MKKSKGFGSKISLFRMVMSPSFHKIYLFSDHHLHPNNSSGDSGVSTPDPAKPKKVIYEVVV